MPTELLARLRALRFRYDVSSSGVVEYALLRFLGDASDAELGERLRALGAGRRRTPLR